MRAMATRRLFRDWLSGQALPYVLGVRANTAVWWGEHQPAPCQRDKGERPRKRVKRDARHKPLSVIERGACLAAAELAHGELA